MKNKLLFLSLWCMISICTFSIKAHAQGPCPIVGAANMCYTSTITLTTTGSYSTGSESWSSTDVTIATVAYTAGTGSCTVYGYTPGSVTIKYSDGLGNNCNFPLEVDGATSPSINGLMTECVGAVDMLAGSPPGGAWSSSATTIATVDMSGIVWGAAGGTVTITYTPNSCTAYYATYPMTINPLPDAGSITGLTAVCLGSTITLSDGATGGSWISSDNTTATVDASGIVYSVAVGAVTISYEVTNSCGTADATYPITVDGSVLPLITGGMSAICAGTGTNLTGIPNGGAWNSSDVTIATVSHGAVGGVSGGIVTISYTITNSCGAFIATYPMTINPLPNAGTINAVPPSNTECIGSAMTFLTTGDAGGGWSSSDMTVATVDAGTGVVTGVTAGTTTITYTVMNGCGTASATNTATIQGTVSVSAITGTATVCVGATTALADATTGGAWSSSDAGRATVDGSGVVTGVAAGNPVISYTVTNTCGPFTATVTNTVNPLPSAGTITGAFELCYSSTAALSNATTGGAWSSSNISAATIDASSGVVYGVAGGTTTISYAVTNGFLCTAYATQIVTVDATPNPGSISGTATVCASATTALTASGDASDTWSSTATTIATVDGSGTVTGVAAGTATISYTVTNSCGAVAATQIVTVNPLPDAGSITGTATVCAGATTALTDAATGGAWSSSTTTVATVSGGTVTGVAAGTATITYSVTNGCGTATATLTVTVGAVPTLSGTFHLCPPDAGEGYATTLITPSVTGGTWSGSNTTVASVTGGTIISGSPGTTTITYTTAVGCMAIVEVTVTPIPNAGTVNPTSATIVTGTSQLFTTTGDAGGTWEPPFTSQIIWVGTGTSVHLNDDGITESFTGEIYYDLIDGFGCVNVTDFIPISVHP